MGWDASNECDVFGPDYFSFYKCEVAELLSQDEDFLPSLEISGSAEKLNGTKITTSSSSLFSNCLGPGVSEIKMQQLKSLLRQGVLALSQEVDEMVDAVFNMCELQSHLRLHSNTTASDTNVEQPYKKHKPSISSPPASESQDICVPASSKTSNDALKSCKKCHAKTPRAPEGTQPLCDSCRRECNNGEEPLLTNEKNENSSSEINGGADKEDQRVNDLQFILQTDRSLVDEVVKNKSNELLVVLEHMELNLEDLFDVMMSKCRLMTLPERQQLQRKIKNLPPRNLEAVVEIIQKCRQSNDYSCNDIHIDLEKEDNITLWRLYFYVEAVENARKLCNAR